MKEYINLNRHFKLYSRFIEITMIVMCKEKLIDYFNFKFICPYQCIDWKLKFNILHVDILYKLRNDILIIYLNKYKLSDAEKRKS